MMRYRLLSLAVLVLTSPVGMTSAVLTRSVALDEPPRVARFERAQEPRQGREQTDRFSATYTVGEDGALDLTQIAGDVRVTARPGDQVRIEAVKRVRHRDPDQARRLLEDLRVEVTQVGNRIEVRTAYPRRTNREWSGTVDYEITVPPPTAVSVKTVSGDVAVSGVTGEVRAETVSGNVVVDSTPNLTVAKAVSGDIRARDVSSTNLTLNTVSGNVIASGLKVRTLDAGSVSGDLRLSDLRLERLTAKTVSGNIAFAGDLERGGRYEFNAHSGNIELTLGSETPGFELDASTFSGSVRTDFAVTLRSTSSSGRGSTRAIRGTFGDAGAILAVRSFSGTVSIRRK